jgi:hypothetical protein
MFRSLIDDDREAPTVAGPASAREPSAYENVTISIHNFSAFLHTISTQRSRVLHQALWTTAPAPHTDTTCRTLRRPNARRPGKSGPIEGPAPEIVLPEAASY